MFFQSSEGVMVRWTTKMRGLMVLLAIASASGFASSVDYDFEHCENIVLRWVDSSVNDGTEVNNSNLQDLLFFLHVPRTGGRTYFHCFLRKLYTSDQECPRSYDKLRFDPRKPNCRLMVTHDDYSVMSKLPREKTSVVTVLRNPLDRVFSTYEFSVEVAARFLVHPNLTSATQMTHKLRSKSRGVSTLDIWPWKYLVPWMREDLFARKPINPLKEAVLETLADMLETLRKLEGNSFWRENLCVFPEDVELEEVEEELTWKLIMLNNRKDY